MRRRRPKVTWLPTFGTPRGGEETLLSINGLSSGAFPLQIPREDASAGTLFIYPLTVDQPEGEDPAETVSLADAIGSEWFLRRIVGKLFLDVKAISPPIAVGDGQAAIGAGFFVARSDYSNVNSPTGATDLSTNVGDLDSWANFSPLSSQAMREPWIWRRTWVLSANGWDRGGIEPYPSTNVNYGSSSLDGPHVDAKTKRRVSNDDRLFFALAACEYPFTGDTSPEADPILELTYWLDYRIVGSLRKARNRGVF